MNNDYKGLGLSDEDIKTIEEHGLTNLLDKVKDQQKALELQKQELTLALSKIEKDLSAARDAQMSLLPKDLVGIPNVEFSARFYPSQYVSGIFIIFSV